MTLAAGVPTVFARLLSELDGSHDVSSLRRIMCGGAPVPRSLAAKFVSRGIDFMQGWGMTEMSPTGTATIFLAGDDVGVEQEAIVRAGVAAPGIELRLVADDGGVLPWDGDAVGEIEVRGPWVIEAYLDPDDDSNATRFHDGWLRTGDLGRMAPDGTLEIVDRSKDLIKSGGEWISSLELERELLLHPNVAEVVVVAIPDELWGERPAAVIVTGEGGLEPAELLEFLRGRVPAWWLPDLIRVVDEIPTTPVGKYDKRRLRAQLADELAGDGPVVTDRSVGAGVQRPRAAPEVGEQPLPVLRGESPRASRSPAGRRHGRTPSGRQLPDAVSSVLMHAAVRLVGLAPDEPERHERGQDLVHRLRRHQRASCQLRVGKPGPGPEHGQRRVLPNRQAVGLKRRRRGAAAARVEPADHVAEPRFCARHRTPQYPGREPR